MLSAHVNFSDIWWEPCWHKNMLHLGTLWKGITFFVIIIRRVDCFPVSLHIFCQPPLPVLNDHSLIAQVHHEAYPTQYWVNTTTIVTNKNTTASSTTQFVPPGGTISGHYCYILRHNNLSWHNSTLQMKIYTPYVYKINCLCIQFLKWQFKTVLSSQRGDTRDKVFNIRDVINSDWLMNLSFELWNTLVRSLCCWLEEQ